MERSDAPSSPDAGAERDAPLAPDAGLACSPPEGPHGVAVGDVFADFELPRCDDEPYAFYAGDYCAPSHRASVVIFSALWCTVCQSESSRIDDVVTTPYRDRGVRVMQVLVDGPSPGRPVTAAECAGWDARFELDAEVVYDPTVSTADHYPESSFPVTLLVDEDGRIRFRDVHGGAGLSALTAALDALLAE